MVAKATSPAKEDRYSTAADLAEDLSRYLSGVPTLAKPPTLRKRVATWTRRHRKAVVAFAAACVVGIVGWTVNNSRFAHVRAEIQKAEVTAELTQREANERRAEAMSHLLEAKQVVKKIGLSSVDFFSQIDGTELVQRQLLEEILGHHERTLASTSTKGVIAADFASAHMNIAEVRERLGEIPEALNHYRIAENTLRELAADAPQDLASRAELARCLDQIGRAQRCRGELTAAQAALHEANDLQSDLVATADRSIESQLAWVAYQNDLSLLLFDLDRRSEAAEISNQIVSRLLHWRRLAANDHRLSESLATTYQNASLLWRAEDPNLAKSWLRRAIDTYSSIPPDSTDPTQHQSSLLHAVNALATLSAQNDDVEAAQRGYKNPVDILDELRRAEPFVVDHRRAMAMTLNNLGLVLSQTGQVAEAESVFHQAKQIQDHLVERMPGDMVATNRLGGIHNNLAMIHQLDGGHELAAYHFERGIRLQQAAFDAAPEMNEFRRHLSRGLRNYGRFLRQLSRLEELLQVTLRRRDLCVTDGALLFSVAEDLAQLFNELPESTTRPLASNSGHLLRNKIIEATTTTIRSAQRNGWQPDNSVREWVVRQVISARHQNPRRDSPSPIL